MGAAMSETDKTRAGAFVLGAVVLLVVLAVALPKLLPAGDDPVAEALQTGLPVLVEFGSPDCPPCQAQRPVLSDVARDYSGRVSVVIVNIDAAPAVARKWGVRVKPTLLFITSSGEVVSRVEGAAAREEIDERLSGLDLPPLEYRGP